VASDNTAGSDRLGRWSSGRSAVPPHISCSHRGASRSVRAQPSPPVVHGEPLGQKPVAGVELVVTPYGSAHESIVPPAESVPSRSVVWVSSNLASPAQVSTCY